MGSCSSTMMCRYWDNRYIYWAVYWLFYWHVLIMTHHCYIITTIFNSVGVLRTVTQSVIRYVNHACSHYHELLGSLMYHLCGCIQGDLLAPVGCDYCLGVSLELWDLCVCVCVCVCVHVHMCVCVYVHVCMHQRPYTLLKMNCYSSITMCQYWDNWLIYWEYTDYFTNMSQEWRIVVL